MIRTIVVTAALGLATPAFAQGAAQRPPATSAKPAAVGANPRPATATSTVRPSAAPAAKPAAAPKKQSRWARFGSVLRSKLSRVGSAARGLVNRVRPGRAPAKKPAAPAAPKNARR